MAMNNTVLATSSGNAGSVNQTNTNVNNIHLDDVQKLQQQLQDIKEQVKYATSLCPIAFQIESHSISLKTYALLSYRQCARYVSIVSKIWYFYADMEHVKCAVIKLMAVQFAGKPSKNVFCSFEIQTKYLYTNKYAHNWNVMYIITGIMIR